MTERMMTVKDLADYFQRSEKWVRAAMKNGHILGGRATPDEIRQALVSFPMPLKVVQSKRFTVPVASGGKR
jgi:hypothetical protein